MIFTAIGAENLPGFASVITGDEFDDMQVAVGAVEDDKAVAAAVLSPDGDTLNVDYLYVLPEARRKGVATALLKAVAEEMGALHFSAFFPESEKSLLKFFDSFGLSMVADSEVFTVGVEDFIHSEEVMKMAKQKAVRKVESLAEMNDTEKARAVASVEELLGEYRYSANAFEDTLSFVTRDKKGGITGCFFCEHEEKEIIVSLLYNFSDDPYNLIAMLCRFGEQLIRGEHTDEQILFVSANDKVEAFVKKLIGNIVRSDRMVHAYK